MSGDHNMYGDGTVYRGERSADSGAAIQRYKIGYYSDGWGERSSTPSGIPDASGAWVRYEDHVIAIAAGQATAAPAQPVAQQGAAYAATPTSNYAGRVYEEGFLIGTCPLYTADQLRAFADATYALRASHGQAPAGATKPTEQQILEAAEKAGLWPNTVHSWIPAFHRYHKELANAQPAPARADSVLEDAARYRWLREGNDAKHGAAWHVAVNLYGCEWDAAIDAAIKQGATT